MHRFLILVLQLAYLPTFANVVGSDAQNFNPTTSGLDFVSVHSSETLDRGIFNLGLFVNYAKNPLPYYDFSGASRSKKDSSLTGGDFNMGYGLSRQWDVGLSFPVILNQDVSEDATVGHYSTTGNTEIRVNTKYRLWGGNQGGFALIASANFNRIANNPYLGKNGGPIYNLEMAADTTAGNFALGLNLGYRWRNAGEEIADAGIEPLADQYLASGALSYLIEDWDTKIISEILYAKPQKSQLESATDREYSVLEALLGIKHDANKKLAMHFGFGVGLMNGVSSPDYRVYTGLNYSFGSSRRNKSVQSDPYAEARPRKKLKKKKKLVRAIQPEEVKPEPVPEPKKSTKAEKAQPPPPPVVEETTTAPVEDEIKPAESTETIKDVKVFNRGTFKHIVLQNIEFVPETMMLTPESENYLKNELLPALREMHTRRPIGTIVVEGHTDSVGNEFKNRQLSLERAQLIATVLMHSLELKVPIKAEGVGGASPIADNGNYQGRALNNRVEIKVQYRRTSK